MKHTAQKIIITAAVLLVLLCGSLVLVSIYDSAYVASKEMIRIQSQLETLAFSVIGLRRYAGFFTVWSIILPY